MQEFSSVTASSYDAESLAPMLNDKAADGWSVVSIVAAGTNIVAYLQREAGEHTSDTSPAEETPAEDTAPESSPEESAAPETPEESAAPETPFVPASVPAADEEPAPVEEPAGWASAPDEQSTDTPASTSTEESSIAALAAQVSEPEPEPEPEPAAAAPAAESAVPAGWYADPSGRFELRYWDGTAWTEHVSRAGQQFTDPPVA
jgi:hypothetical protein